MPAKSATTTVTATQPDNGLAVAALVLGVVSFTGFGILTGVPAIILGCIALKRPGARSYSLAGIITGAVASFLSILFFVILVILALLAPGSIPDNNPAPTGPNWQPGWSNTGQTDFPSQDT